MEVFFILSLLFFTAQSSYLEPQPITIPTSFSILSLDQTEITECTTNPHTNIFTAAYLFDSIKNSQIIVTSENSTLSMFLEDHTHTCKSFVLNAPVTIDTSVQYKMVFYSTEQLESHVTVNLAYYNESDPDGKQNMTITDFPFFRYVTVPANSSHIEDFCSNKDTDQDYQVIYGDMYYISAEEDLTLEINTCGHTDMLTAIHVIYENGGKCLNFSDTYLTADLRCGGGMGTRVVVQAHPHSPLRVYAGFLVQSVESRDFLLNVTKLGDAPREQEDWELWLWFGVICGVIIVFVVIVLGSIIIFELVRERAKEQICHCRRFLTLI
ncbi:hypothetical protein EIN_168900, partial [Entamoeba invadens IP1]